jgi:ubiquinone/menaquinone biosynthesis C-methylase UbiE
LSVVRQREIDLLDVEPGHRVLDLGCGRGETTHELVRRGAEVVAMDYSWDAAQLTHEGAAGAASVLQADGTRLPFTDGSFDRVLLSDVIEHVPWTMSIQMMNEVHRVLSPTGQALVHTAPNVWFIALVKRPLVLLLRLTRRKPALERFALYDQLRYAMHPNELSPVTLRRLMRATNFDAVNCWVDRDVLRSNSSEWTGNWSPRVVSVLSATAGSWPLRLLLGNDMYSIAVSDRSALPDARRRRRASFSGAVSD